MAQDLSRHGPSTADAPSGASQLVLGGQLTEGVSDLSEEWAAPGGVPALREVNQNRSHPDAPFVEEQSMPGAGDYRRIVSAQPAMPVAPDQLPGQGSYRKVVQGASTWDDGRAGWDTVSPGARGPVRDFGPRPHAGQNVPPHRPPNPAADADELMAAAQKEDSPGADRAADADALMIAAQRAGDPSMMTRARRAGQAPGISPSIDPRRVL